MKQINYKKRAIGLSILWGVALQIFGGIASVYLNTYGQTAEIAPLELFSGYMYVVLAYCVCFSSPLLFYIRKNAKIANMKVIVFFSNIMLLHHSMWLILLIFEIISALVR